MNIFQGAKLAFEKEIKAGKKIADDWLARSEGDEAYFTLSKKENVKWEKDYGAHIDKEINEGSADVAMGMINSSRAILDDIEKACDARYKAHSDFVRGNPRRGTDGVCMELKLKEKDAAYKPVCAALDKMLIAHTKQFKQTEQAWTLDLLPRITMLRSKLDTFEKLAKGTDSKISAYAKQFGKDAAAYKAQADTTISKVKPSMADLAISQIFADPSKWLGGVDKVRLDQLKIFRDRVDMIDKLLALADKNYNRVLKAVPDDIKNKMMFARSLKTFEIVHSEAKKDLLAAKLSFKTAVSVIEKNYPALV